MPEITRTDIDNLADIIWWIKGYVHGAKDAYASCPFNKEHVESLRKIRVNWRDNQKKGTDHGNNIHVR